MEKHGIAYHEKTLGQLFCDGPAQQIVAMLEAECRAAGVRIQTNVNVERVSKEDGFLLRTDDENFTPSHWLSRPVASQFLRWALQDSAMIGSPVWTEDRGAPACLGAVYFE